MWPTVPLPLESLKLIQQKSRKKIKTISMKDNDNNHNHDKIKWIADPKI